ncbi:cutinase family protein [Mycobacterium sp. CBMA 234]|uniref:cutinase family protein n=1 Tax=Mycolicibacterium sp. CBMA 234 TaxID=1918495 RepID=UPI001EE45438|nr:cutinase family protein [Mycolicibacterium sp. CBMA 234]MUL64065.1 cutinase family protein [Mycolicibacterium sp. CBMA 234]
MAPSSVMTSVRYAVATASAAASVATGLLVATAAAPSSFLGVAAAAPCPQVEVVFARGRNEQPGVGRVGTAFVDALRAKTPQNVGVYAVNYPANIEIPQGANDISSHIQYMAANCPNTRLVIGGYSLGAASATMALSSNDRGFGFDKPLPPGMDSHIAAVALFGNVTHRMGGGNISPIYQDRTIDQCNGTDPVCMDGLPQISELQADWQNHLQDGYIGSGMVDQAADFVAGRLAPAPAP